MTTRDPYRPDPRFPTPQNRDDLMALMARSVRKVLNYANERLATAIADNILRDMRASGLRIHRVKMKDERED
jgi:hypothetical protein